PGALRTGARDRHRRRGRSPGADGDAVLADREPHSGAGPRRGTRRRSHPPQAATRRMETHRRHTLRIPRMTSYCLLRESAARLARTESAVDPDRPADRSQYPARTLAGLARTCRQILVEVRARLDEFLVTLAQRTEFRVDDIEQLVLQLPPTDATLDQPAAGVGHDLGGGELLENPENG